MNELSRFKPLDHLPLSPGVCFICSGGVGPFIDTSRQLEFEGAIYICLGCVKEMAAQLGLNFMLNEEEVELRIAQARIEGEEHGELAMMGKFSEFVSNYADRSDRADADVPSVSHDNPVETPEGAKQGEPKPRQDYVQSDGLTGIEEFGIISGYTSDGKSLFDLP